MTLLLLIALALAAGCSLSIQAGVNGRLGAESGLPVWATMASFLIGLIFLLPFTLVPRVAWPTIETMTAVRWWAWTGGLIGAAYVALDHRDRPSPRSRRLLLYRDCRPDRHGAPAGPLRLAGIPATPHQCHALDRRSAHDRRRSPGAPLLVWCLRNSWYTLSSRPERNAAEGPAASPLLL